ncbi:hypothetical protein PABG_04576 [Paracoccidioides brasiliensis Pb03]|nr:hypothetical protein PABG_04576 [Paracoccidioides brasiliensis Pb03]
MRTGSLPCIAATESISYDMSFLNLQFPEVQHEINEPLKCRETVDDIHACNEYLTRRVSELFTAIKILEEQELPNHQPTGLCLTIESPFQSDKNDRHCNHRRFHGWRVQLLNPENLPKLFSVHTLIIGENRKRNTACKDERPLDLRVMADLVSKLLNLKVLNCRYFHERFPNYSIYPIISHFTRPLGGSLERFQTCLRRGD